MPGRPRIVIAVPLRAECDLFADWLSAEGFAPVAAPGLEAATAEIGARAFDLLIADFALAFRDGLHAVGRARNALTPLVTVGDADRAAQALAERRGAMYLERPVDRAALVCAVSMAIIDGRPVRRSPRKTVDRFDAVVDGAPSWLIDVSNEGLRLELPRGRRSPPPYFTVRVPAAGVNLIVQRVWACAPPEGVRAGVAWCGGALARNSSRVEQAWRAFVDAIPGLESASAEPVQPR